MTIRHDRAKAATATALLLWPILLVGVAIVLHEGGHWLTAMAVGLPDPVLHYDRITHDESGTVSSQAMGLVGLAGPTVSVMLIILGLVIGRSRRAMGLALAAAAASRLVVGIPYTLVALAMLVSGRRLAAPAFDESKAAQALGLAPESLMAVSTAAFFIALVAIYRMLPRGLRLIGLGALIAGCAAGWALWMLALGPVVLP